jgi:hypothetical protein
VTASAPGRFLGRIVAALDGAAVSHMLAGSFASGIHGTPRSTQDLDIVIDPSFDSLDRFLEALAGDVAREQFKRRGQFNVIDTATF